ncbi:MAG TPA: Do family serine endopeptidase [Terracidiphilus sp.]|jgi:serine protease Do|nr:Do family serine endopeptidase [Terracidiphilus sp.]
MTKKLSVPAAVVAAFALGAAVFVGHGRVAAASNTPLDDNSVSALMNLDHAMEAVAAKVTPSVVNVAVTARANGDEMAQNGGGQQLQLPPGMQQFFGPNFPQGQQPQQQPIEHGVGSGVIISPDGYIVTNNHVVDGAMQIKVTLHDRRVFSAKVVGTDKLTDLAVLKINASDLSAISWGDSAALEPGQTVLAFGSPFGYFQFSVTRGIVSAVNRGNPYSNDARKPGGYIQTDAAINPGNSGGPLVDARGQVVGINTFIISDSGSFAGAGFAIPAQIVRTTADQIVKHGKVEHGYLGVNINPVTPQNAQFFGLKDASGAIVSQVHPDTPASRAGLKQGDVITAVNGQKVTDNSGLQIAITEMTPGTAVKLGVVRDGKPTTLDLTVGQYNASGEQASNENGNGGQKGRIGVAVGNLDDNARQQFNVPDQVRGAVVQQVKPGSPADDAGVQPGDVIEEIDRKGVASASQFADAVRNTPADKDILLLVWSHGNASYVTIHPDESVGQVQ